MKHALILFLLTGIVTSTFGASLKNAGFESGKFGRWQPAGEGWRTSAFKADIRHGRFGAVNEVVIGGGDEYRVLHQEIKTVGGKKYEAQVWIRTACIEGSESFLEIQFMDKSGNVLKQYQSRHIDNITDFVLVKIENMEAPQNTYQVSIRGVVHVTKAPEGNSDYHIFDEFKFRRAKKSRR